jgi:hypothetical protein
MVLPPNMPYPRNVLGLLAVELSWVVANRSGQLNDTPANIQQMLHNLECFTICATTSRLQWLAEAEQGSSHKVSNKELLPNS